ncbi:MAG: DeoR/GlpR transcriptional regulator [Acidobacteria bacterium]|nr:DeoR/GlpR transcriptional regulator [Acidobacteriota bacterium]
MLIEERRQHVLARIQQEGRVLVSELSDSLGISRITIRKDLDDLEARGLVQRTHGGALAPQSNSLLDPSLQVKERQQLKEKLRIADTAAKMVREGQCVLLDSGTTTTAIARALRAFKHLTVVTNALNIAADLASTNFEVILTGGTLRKNSASLVGPLAEEMLGELHADILFLGVDGFDPQVGITTPNVLESRVNRAMVKSARRVIAVCDSTKFNRQSLALIVPSTAIQMVITDTGAKPETVEALKTSGIEVILV